MNQDPTSLYDALVRNGINGQDAHLIAQKVEEIASNTLASHFESTFEALKSTMEMQGSALKESIDVQNERIEALKSAMEMQGSALKESIDAQNDRIEAIKSAMEMQGSALKESIDAQNERIETIKFSIESLKSTMEMQWKVQSQQFDALSDAVGNNKWLVRIFLALLGLAAALGLFSLLMPGS